MLNTSPARTHVLTAAAGLLDGSGSTDVSPEYLRGVTELAAYLIGVGSDERDALATILWHLANTAGPAPLTETGE